VEEFESKHNLSVHRAPFLAAAYGTVGSACIVPFILSQLSSMSISEVAITLQIKSQAVQVNGYLIPIMCPHNRYIVPASLV
jgi:hypothetical protein